MRRLRLFDAALLVILVPLWLVCFALHVKEVTHGRLARVPVFVSIPEDANAYPVLLGFWPGSKVAASGLTVGDQLTRLGEADLRGAGPIGFVARAYEQAQGQLGVRVSFTRAGRQDSAVLSFDPFILPWGVVPMTLGFAVIGVLVLLRMPRSRPAQAFFLASMAYSIHWSLFFGGPRWQTYAWVVIYFLSSLVIFPLILRTVLVLPEEVAPTNRWMFVWPWLFALRGPTAISWYFGAPLPHEIGMRATNLLEAAFVVTLLVLLTRNFRRAGPLGRRQIKWVVYGLYISTVPVLAAAIITILEPRLWWLQEASMSALVLLPICICIAIVRFNLFDIDRLISSTASYTLLSLLLLGGILTVIPHLSQVASTALGADRMSWQIVFSVFLAVMIAPGQRYLRPQIERVFFREHYALERGVKHLPIELSACQEPQELFTLVGERLDTLLRPESCVIYGYGQADAAYTPVFIRGSAVPPTFEVRSPLIKALQTRISPLDVEQWRRMARVYLGPTDREALDSLRAAVALPVSRSEPPAFFVCLGQKRSGDVYTSTDFTLLATVGDKVSGTLLSFDDAEIRCQTGAMQAALHRSVP